MVRYDQLTDMEWNKIRYNKPKLNRMEKNKIKYCAYCGQE